MPDVSLTLVESAVPDDTVVPDVPAVPVVPIVPVVVALVPVDPEVQDPVPVEPC
jgi:hypothetical protein